MCHIRRRSRSVAAWHSLPAPLCTGTLRLFEKAQQLAFDFWTVTKAAAKTRPQGAALASTILCGALAREQLFHCELVH